MSASYFLSDLCEFTTSQQLQVRGQGTGFYHLAETLFVMGGPKEDIVPECCILNPGLLWHKGERALGESRLRNYTQISQTAVLWISSRFLWLN